MSTLSELGTDTYDVAIVGSGIGGLIAAALLAKAGARVFIAEQGSGPGGYAHAFRRGPYTFDPAVHLIGDAALFDGLLRHLGVRDRCTFLPVDYFYRVELPDFSLDAPFGKEAFIAAHVERFPHEAANLRRFFDLCAQVHREAHDLPPQLSLRGLDEAARRFPALFRYRKATLAEVLDEQLTDPRCKAVCGAAWIYLGIPPSRVSFQTFAQLLFSHMDGAFTPEGGVQRLVDALVAALERDRGELALGCRVDRILIEDSRAVGMRLADGRDIRAARVISNADPRQTFERLVGEAHLPARFLRTYRRLTPSGSAFLLFAATTLDLRGRDAAHQIFHFKTWDHEEAYRQMLRGQPWVQFMTPSSVADPTLAPPGEHVVVAAALVPYDIGTPWGAEKERCAQTMLDAIEGLFPGFRAGLTFAESATPLTLERYSLNYRGAIHSWEQTPEQTESKRPSQLTPIEGLYLSSQWTSSGGSFLRAIMSGIHTAKLVLDQTGAEEVIPDFRGVLQP